MESIESLKIGHYIWERKGRVIDCYLGSQWLDGLVFKDEQEAIKFLVGVERYAEVRIFGEPK